MGDFIRTPGVASIFGCYVENSFVPFSYFRFEFVLVRFANKHCIFIVKEFFFTVNVYEVYRDGSDNDKPISISSEHAFSSFFLKYHLILSKNLECF